MLLDNDRDLPKNLTTLSDDPNKLPFFTPTHMFVKKVECLAVRLKDTDRADLIYLFDNFELNSAKIKKRVTMSQRDEALERHSNDSRVTEILASLDVN